MKKLLVALTVTGIMVGSLATVSLAKDDYHKEDGPHLSNRYNGSYYYDVAWSRVTPNSGYRSEVIMFIKKNGSWSTGKLTKVPKNSSVTCYSHTIQGSGANGAISAIADYLV